jgi:hypothetical protein
MGVKLILLMFFMVHLAELDCFMWLQVSIVHDAGWLARAGLVPAVRCCGY